MEALYCFCSSGVRISPSFGAGVGGGGAGGGGAGVVVPEDAAAGAGDVAGRAGFFAAGAGLFN